MIISWILTLSILIGQLIKIPIAESQGGASILDVVIIVLCLLGLFNLKFKLKKPPLFVKTGLFFIVIATVSLILTPLNLAPIQYLISFFYTIRFASFLLLGFLIYSNAYPSLLKNIPNILTFSGITLAILGLIQLIFLPDLMFLEKFGWDPHYFRTVSTFLDPSFIGAYFTFTLILLVQEPNFIQKWQKIIFMIVYLALLTTFSRGTYLMFVVSFVTLTLLKRSLKLAILTTILSLGLLLGYSAYHKNIAEPRNIDRGQSAQFRLNSWQRGLTIFTKSPILGVGYNAYRYALKQYNLAPENYLASKGGTSNDASLLHVASTTGVIGLIGFLLFLSSLIWPRKRNLLPFKSEWVILVSALLGLIVHSFFANSLFYPFLLIWIILMAAKLHL